MSEVEKPAKQATFKAKLKSFYLKAKATFFKHFLPISLLLSILIALAWPLPGKKVAEPQAGAYGGVVQLINVIIIFIISGLQMQTSEIKRAIKQYKGIIWGSLSILLFTPMLGFAAVHTPFKPQEFAFGLAIFIATPTTLSSGVVLTQQAKGNAALALLLVVITNLIGIVTVPFLLRLILNSGTKINASSLLIKLVITVLCPLVVGKVALELSPKVQAFTKKYKQYISMFSTFNLTMVAWQALSKSRDTLVAQSGGNIMAIIAAAIVAHLVFLAFNWTAMLLLKVPWTEAKAVIINTSQKTLPVSLTIITFLNVGTKAGLYVIPCVISHLAQLFIDSVIAAKWASNTWEPKRAKEERIAEAKAKEDAKKAKAVAEAGAPLENGAAATAPSGTKSLDLIRAETGKAAAGLDLAASGADPAKEHPADRDGGVPVPVSGHGTVEVVVDGTGGAHVPGERSPVIPLANGVQEQEREGGGGSSKSPRGNGLGPPGAPVAGSRDGMP